uniref:Uncharacterized protein n=1 Tax=Arundo donax TaxID=35708 RepID=A0A0A9HYN3_ARUDO
MACRLHVPHMEESRTVVTGSSHRLFISHVLTKQNLIFFAEGRHHGHAICYSSSVLREKELLNLLFTFQLFYITSKRLGHQSASHHMSHPRNI